MNAAQLAEGLSVPQLLGVLGVGVRSGPATSPPVQGVPRGLAMVVGGQTLVLAGSWG